MLALRKLSFFTTTQKVLKDSNRIAGSSVDSVMWYQFLCNWQSYRFFLHHHGPKRTNPREMEDVASKILLKFLGHYSNFCLKNFFLLQYLTRTLGRKNQKLLKDFIGRAWGEMSETRLKDVLWKGFKEKNIGDLLERQSPSQISHHIMGPKRQYILLIWTQFSGWLIFAKQSQGCLLKINREIRLLSKLSALKVKLHVKRTVFFCLELRIQKTSTTRCNPKGSLMIEGRTRTIEGRAYNYIWLLI